MSDLPPPPPPPAPPPPPPPPLKTEVKPGPSWAMAIGCIAIALSLLVAIGSASRRDLEGSESAGYVVGSLIFPILLMMGGRWIWKLIQKDKAGPVFDWAWLIFGTGLLALFFSLSNAGRDAQEEEENGDARAPVVRVELRPPL